MWPFIREVPPAAQPLTLDQLHEVAKQNRHERRREQRRNKIVAARESARVCWRCGFGALKGISYSNIVRMKDNEGNAAWGHAQPTVCAGAIRAITAQARMKPSEALRDFLNIAKDTLGQFIRAQITLIWTFLNTEDPSVNRRGPRIRENTRVKT